MRWLFLPFVATLWLGTLPGVSFLATPVEFKAASLALLGAPEVGRVTFTLFAKLGCLLAAGVVGIMLSRPPRLLRWYYVAAVTLVVIVQALWLLPTLDARVTTVILARRAVAPASHHLLRIGAELVKMPALLALSTESLPILSGRSPGRDLQTSPVGLSPDPVAVLTQGN